MLLDAPGVGAQLFVAAVMSGATMVDCHGLQVSGSGEPGGAETANALLVARPGREAGVRSGHDGLAGTRLIRGRRTERWWVHARAVRSPAERSQSPYSPRFGLAPCRQGRNRGPRPRRAGFPRGPTLSGRCDTIQAQRRRPSRRRARTRTPWRRTGSCHVRPAARNEPNSGPLRWQEQGPRLTIPRQGRRAPPETSKTRASGPERCFTWPSSLWPCSRSPATPGDHAAPASSLGRPAPPALPPATPR